MIWERVFLKMRGKASTVRYSLTVKLGQESLIQWLATILIRVGFTVFYSSVGVLPLFLFYDKNIYKFWAVAQTYKNCMYQ